MKISAVSKFVLSLTLAFSLVSFSYAKENEGEKLDKKTKSSAVAFDASIYKVSNSNKVNLAIDKVPDATVNVILRNTNGDIIYEEALKDNNHQYRRVFNLEGMEDGTYYFELYNKDRKITKKLEIATSSNKVVVL
ncbi:hypothetical protein ACFP1I_02995 [Dyadobacter subterraneus]|uniref:Por secretion system C-terminal sorting domain-containing protein n=1 Tax=Dyadobacter subterraneus TaxID=2773304 RepID=A0ABR9W4Q5_9BACT|nr:hypothetical protein [Dyadobacter subterraneus]MBE9460438.1 hypothetical protein [Dyadobacter subterraneus]